MRSAKAQFGLLAILLVLLTGGCASGPEVSSAGPGDQDLELLPTADYLPQRERDEQGRPLPYRAMPNPYTVQNGQLEKDIVDSYIRARRDFQNGNYAAADSELEQLVEEEPSLSGPLVMRGDIALENGRLDEAVEFYQQALDTNEVNFNAWLRLAKAQRLLGQFRRSQNTYASALALWPDGPELHLNLGVLYDLYLNKPLEAQAHMEAYQLISGDRSGEVVSWLQEIRERTGVDQALEAAREPQTEVADAQLQTRPTEEE